MHVEFPDGTAANFNFLSTNAFTGTLQKQLARGAQLLVQVSLREAAAARTEIVDTTATVKLRPDLELRIDGPRIAGRGKTSYVRIVARELNWDTAVTATCRLFVDGVDAGAQVISLWQSERKEVRFPATFDRVGQSSLRVIAESVEPGDWDDSNNSDANVVEVREPEEVRFGGWSAQAVETEFEEHFYGKEPWREEWRDNKGVEQIYSFSGTFWHVRSQLRPRTCAHDHRHAAAVRRGQRRVEDHSLVGRVASTESGMPDIRVCYDQVWDYTSVEIRYAAADAVYHSRGWKTREHPWAPDEPMTTWDTTREETSMQSRFGATVSMSIELTAGEKTWRAEPLIVPAMISEERRDEPYRCVYDDYIGAEVCGEVHSYRRSRSGTAQSVLVP